MMDDQTPQRPKPFQMDNDFARQTMARRVPGIVRDVQSVNPDYPVTIMRALDRLHDALVENEPIPMLAERPVPAPDYDDWEAAYRTQCTKIDPLTWQHSEWFFAETFLYRHLIQAVRWFETGRDPFLPKKQTEFEGEHLWELLDAALDVDGNFGERLSNLLSFALWGNRVDLSHPAGTLAGEPVTKDDLLVDDRDSLLGCLEFDENGPHVKNAIIHIVTDNAGTELAMDLVLADFLLVGGSQMVVLQVKSHPTFVSDATVDDVWGTIHALEMHGGKHAALADRLRRAWEDERITIAAPPFWTSSHFLWDMPPKLKQAFGAADLVVLKGDANYRRAIGDAMWDDSTSFSSEMDYFPAPIVALRSLKSDALVGLPANLKQKLDAESDTWRTTGRYGVIQFAAKPRG